MDSNQSQKSANILNSSHGDKIRWTDDLFSALTIEECERFFDQHYETNLDQLAEARDKLSLLRSCIELLNRLDNSTNHLFAGRVLIFLARVIPLYDQSGVNLKSEFNIKPLPPRVVEHLHQISLKHAEKDKKISRLLTHEIEEGETISDEDSNDSNSKEDIDKIYERFWKIQQYLNQPGLLYDKTNWFTFRSFVDSLIGRMEAKPAVRHSWNTNKSYMTDPETLILQLNDFNMRRCIFVQILITLQYLELPVETKPETFVLDKTQLTWSGQAAKRIYNLLDSMPNQEEGRKFSYLFKQFLRREELWNKWKNEKCKEPKKLEDDEEIVNMRGTYHKRRKISDELASAKPLNLYVIGSQDMNRLWNMRQGVNVGQPNLEKFINIPFDKQETHFKDPNYSFNVLRLLRKSPHFFSQSSQPIQSIPEYLRAAALRTLPPSGDPITNNSTTAN